MADIELVIKIPEELISEIGDENYQSVISWYDTSLYCAIKTGTPLPKGPGRLIDADALGTSIENRYADMELDGYDPLALGTYADMVDDLVGTAPTIIEADKGEQE